MTWPAPLDRISGTVSPPRPGWTGRWVDQRGYVLDKDVPGIPGQSRDDIESDDVDALLTLRMPLAAAMKSQSWLELEACPLLAGHEDEASQLHAREILLAKHMPSLARISERFLTRVGEQAELLPVARVRRPARRALERLVAHTEDWAGRSLAGPVPRRALAVTREEDADLYENRLVVELARDVLSVRLAQRLRRLRRRQNDLAELERARNEGTHQRLQRLYGFWGQDAARAADSSLATAETIRDLQVLQRQVSRLSASRLARRLKGKRTGQRSLRHTNVIENDQHYRAAGLVWTAYATEPLASESDEERDLRYRERHAVFSWYVFGLVVRALSALSYAPRTDELPTAGEELKVHGPWGSARVHLTRDAAIELEALGIRTRFVPVLDLVQPEDDPAAIASRWRSLTESVTARTVVVYLAASEPLTKVGQPLAGQILSAGPDTLMGGAALSGVPVSPLETTSLERIARAVALSVLEPAMAVYPPVLTLEGRAVPRRLLDHLESAGIQQPGLPMLFHRASVKELCLRRPLMPLEQQRLDQMIRVLCDQAKAPGWQRDHAVEINALAASMASATAEVGRLLSCPVCRQRAEAGQVSRNGPLFMINCRSCSTRWGHERCPGCAGRVAVIRPKTRAAASVARVPGWVERTFGQDCLSSPCWAADAEDRFICPTCGTCPVALSGASAGCQRCSTTTGGAPGISSER